MRITRVYTRTGDKGTTGLADGSRVPKTSLRLESYGTIDELNAVLGMCRTQVCTLSPERATKLDSVLEAIQNDLFNLGADFATPLGGRWQGMLLVAEADVTALENVIDECQEELAPLKEFVLPGGTPLNATLHLARTVCRRAERASVALQETEDVNAQGVPYLNRLSDLLFVLSRWVLCGLNVPEVTWSKEKGIRSVRPLPSKERNSE
ncbi:MAG: cob(I)yrinic acid a,c-diamide adenosyltransferase [Silvanigrellales bacterium]|jgi:cob(I)alamin adenosyltransferase|nr:cob(I)yrinic acid a,c-diamide adenosyltransferase [Silvanigrellales bacterium]